MVHVLPAARRREPGPFPPWPPEVEGEEVTDVHDRAEAVKARWTMPVLIEHLTGEPVPASNKVQSLFNPDDMTPSMHVYADSVYCYSTGTYADVISLVQKVKRCSFFSALELLEEEADSLSLDAIVRVKEEPKPFVIPGNKVDRTVAWNTPLAGIDQPFWDMMFDWNVVWETDQGLLAIPHCEARGGMVGIKYRATNGQKTAEPGSCFTKGLYQVPLYTSPGSLAIIVEGESDCWAMTNHYNFLVNVFALPSGASTVRAEWFEGLIERHTSVYVCMDNDRAGEDARAKLHSALNWAAKGLYVPGLFKDAREALAAGWQPDLR